MSRFLALMLGAAALGAAVPARADSTVSADKCSIASASMAIGNTVTCNFGLTPEQLKAVVDAVRSGEHASDMGQLLDRIQAISAKLGVTEGAARTLLGIVGEKPDVPDEQLADELTRIADDYMRLREQVAALDPDNPTARDLVEKAKAAIEAGHFPEAHQLLSEATKVQIAAAQEARKLREQAQAAEDAQMLGAAASTATEGDLAMTEGQYAQAADAFSQASELVPQRHSDDATYYTECRAYALYRQGDERGDNAALQQAITIYASLGQEQQRTRVPQDWAATQTNLGNALQTLGKRESGTAHLDEAVAAYRAALQKQTLARAPLEWATTQNDLGIALYELGERESSTAHLEEAVAAFRAVAQVFTQARAPLGWAWTQANLGAALAVLGERERSTARLNDAVAAFRAALQEYTRAGVRSLDWANTQGNLGNAFVSIYEIERNSTMANALMGVRKSPIQTRPLSDAVDAFQAALTVLQQKNEPMRWAEAQFNMANTLALFAEQSNNTEVLEKAASAERAVLLVITPDLDLPFYAKIQVNLGYILSGIGGRTGQRRPFEDALQAFTLARDAFEKAGMTRNRDSTLEAIAATTGTLGEIKDSAKPVPSVAARATP